MKLPVRELGRGGAKPRRRKISPQRRTFTTAGSGGRLPRLFLVEAGQDLLGNLFLGEGGVMDQLAAVDLEPRDIGRILRASQVCFQSRGDDVTRMVSPLLIEAFGVAAVIGDGGIEIGQQVGRRMIFRLLGSRGELANRPIQEKSCWSCGGQGSPGFFGLGILATNSSRSFTPGV